MSPRPQIDHIRRPQILAAASQVIAERGIAATRIADIATRVGISGPALLYWFDSKDALLSEALGFAEQTFYEALDERLGQLEQPGERLVMLIEASVADYDWTLWMEIWTRALRHADVAQTRQRLDRRWRSEIEREVRAGQASGEFAADDDPERVAAIIASLLDGLAVQATLADPDFPAARIKELTIEIAERLLGTTLPELDRDEKGQTRACGARRRRRIDGTQPIDRLLADQLSRRDVMKVTGGLALGASLSACGVGGNSSSSSADTQKVIKPKVDGDLVYFNWAQYLDPKLFKEFEKKYGVSVRQSNFDSMAGMMAKLRSGNQLRRDLPERRVRPEADQGESAARDPARQADRDRRRLPVLRRPLVRRRARHTPCPTRSI